MRPGNILTGCNAGRFTTLLVWLLYIIVSLAGLFVPGKAFMLLRPWLYRLAKRSGTKRANDEVCSAGEGDA
jgi:hypothetical protein